MAMSPQCIDAFLETLEAYRKTNPEITTVKVISMGNPDILRSVEDFPQEIKEKLEVHPEAHRISGYHGRQLNLPTSESFFRALNCELVCVDVKKWRGDELLLDLNTPLSEPSLVNSFDILLDMGTTEHCFNIGVVMQNYLKFVKLGGFIIHWNPLWMPNHGFYNLNPTFYHDWYMANGGGIELISSWEYQGPTEPERMSYVPYTERFNYRAENLSNLVIVKKIEEVREYTWPIQTKYAKMDKMGA